MEHNRLNNLNEPRHPSKLLFSTRKLNSPNLVVFTLGQQYGRKDAQYN